VPDSSHARGMRRSEPALKPRKRIRSNALLREKSLLFGPFCPRNLSDLPRSGYRTKPGVLTPGITPLSDRPEGALGERNREFARNCPSHSFSRPNGGLRREYRDHLNPQIHPLQKCEQPFPESRGNGRLPGSLVLGTPMPPAVAERPGPTHALHRQTRLSIVLGRPHRVRARRGIP
jgi:hypothetical protein